MQSRRPAGTTRQARRQAVLGLLAALSVALAPAASGARTRGAPPPEAVRTGVAAAVVDGDTLRLESGVEVRLVGIQAPKLPLGRRGFRKWPLAEEAKRALEALTLGKRLALSYGGRKSDRHGRLLAHLATPSGEWVQGALLRQGMARVYSFADNRARIPEMLAAERAARTARRGVWALDYYRIRTPDGLMRDIGTFQLVEGRVVSAAVVRRRGYLNFGRNWRTDFTISISPGAMRRFAGNGPPLARYEGRRVRVRGWLRGFNGPMIEATHPEQIELLP